MPEPLLHELVNYVKLYGALAASRHYEMGYSVVRRRIRSANVNLNRGRRRDRTLTPRNAQIRVQRIQGCFLIDIGKAFNLGRERIRQILAATGGDPLKGQDEPSVGPSVGPPGGSGGFSGPARPPGASVSRKRGVKTAVSKAASPVQPTPTQADVTPAQTPSALPSTQPS
jgi:hypothetical protein